MAMRAAWLAALTAAGCGRSPEPAFEKQTAWLRSYVDGFNKHDADAIARLHAPDAVFTELGEQGQESRGSAEIIAEYRSIFDGFPDARTTVTRSWHMGDAMLFEYIEGGTSTGHDETPPKPYGYVGASLVWFDEAGRVVRDQTYY